jgi:hypothetical protein
VNDPDAPANNPVDLFFNVKINPEDMENIKRHSNPMCRFTSKDGKKVVFTQGILLHVPITSDVALANTPNSIKCKSPRWDLNGTSEDLDAEVSLNGQNYFGRIAFTITDPLKLHRIVPIAGPISASTQMRLIGSGFRPRSTKLQISSKWGPILTNDISRAEVSDYTWSFPEFLK